MRDVVVTGLGVVSPIGCDVATFWAGLLAGKPCLSPLDYPGTAVHSALTYQVDDDTPTGADGLGRATRFALAASRAALADAGFGTGAEWGAGAGVGVYTGTGTGDGDLLEAYRDGRRALSMLNWFPYGTAGLIARELGLTGPARTVSTACAAGAYAVSCGADTIAEGSADIMLVGGTEGVSRPAMGAFLRLGAVDPVHCRPFDADRRGTVYGEGAAFLVLESAEHAAARGRRPYARVAGAGWSCDAFHATAPAPDGVEAVRAARDALDRAGTAPSGVGAVIAHGTGTPLNDRMESLSMREVLGARLAKIPVTAIKATLGHSGGAAGAFSCLTAALVASTGTVPPTANLRSLDPACDLRVVQGLPAAVEGSGVLVNAYAFGGNNISLLISAVDDEPGEDQRGGAEPGEDQRGGAESWT